MKYLKLPVIVTTLCLVTFLQLASQNLVFEININSLGSKITDGSKTYFLVLGDSVKGGVEDISNGSYVKTLISLLSEKGYQRVLDTLNTKFEYLVEYNYFISQPQETIITSYLPVSNQPQTQVNVYNNGAKSQQNNSNENPYKSGAVILDNKQTVTDYKEVRKTVMYFNKEMKINCYHNSSDQRRIIWQIQIDSKGTSDDLRIVMPAFLMLANDYIEVDSKYKRTVLVKTNGKDMKRFLAKFNY